MKVAKLNKLARKQAVKDNYVRRVYITDGSLENNAFPLPRTSIEQPCMAIINLSFGNYIGLSYVWDTSTQHKYIRAYNINDPQEWVLLCPAYRSSDVRDGAGWTILHTNKHNTVYYKSCDDIPISMEWGATVVEHTYENGIGKYVFAHDIETIPQNLVHPDERLLSITFPDTTTVIGSKAFYNSALKNIYIAGKNMFINSEAFAFTNAFTVTFNNTSVDFDNSVFLTAGIGHFYGPLASEDTFVLYRIDSRNNARDVVRVSSKIPDGYKVSANGWVLARAIENYTSSKTISIDAEGISGSGVEGRFTQINLSKNVSMLESTAIYTYSNCDVVCEYEEGSTFTNVAPDSIDSDGIIKVIVPNKAAVDAKFDAEVRSIKDLDKNYFTYTLRNNTALPNFAHCPELNNKIIYHGLSGTTLKVVLDTDTLEIPENAFAGMQFKTLSIGRNIKVTKIHKYAFKNISADSVDLVVTNGIIDDFAFYNCNIGYFMQKISESTLKSNAFAGAYLDELDWDSFDDFYTNTYEGEFASPWSAYKQEYDYVEFTGDTNVPKYTFANSSVRSISLDSDITVNFGDYAFAGSSLNDITNDSKLSCGEYCFADTQLTHVDINWPLSKGMFAGSTLSSYTLSSQGTIPEECFKGTNLTEIIIDSQIKTIESQAFADCEAVIKCQSKEPAVIKKGAAGQDPFYGNVRIEVPEGSESAYRKQWSDSSNMIFSDYDNRPVIVYTTYDNSIITLPRDFEKVITLHTFENGVGKIELAEGVTTLPDSAFKQTTIQSVQLPKVLQTIGNQSFAECVYLNGVNLNNVQIIGQSAFTGCSSLISVTIPCTVTRIKQYGFADCTSLVNLGFEDINVDSIIFDDGVFNGCSQLKNVTLPKNALVRSNIFVGCHSLKTVNDANYLYGQSVYNQFKALVWANPNLTEFEVEDYVDGVLVRDIGKSAFENSAIKSIKFGSGIKSIASKAFSKCRNLKNVRIPDTVTYIGSEAFSGCSSLQTIDFDTSQFSLDSYGSICTGCYSLNTFVGTVITDPKYLVLNNKLYDSALSGCTEAYLPDGIVEVFKGAIDSPNIQKLVIPATVKDMHYLPGEKISSRSTVEFLSETPPDNISVVGTSIKMVVPDGALINYKEKYPKYASYFSEKTPASEFVIEYESSTKLDESIFVDSNNNPVTSISHEYSDNVGIIKYEQSSFPVKIKDSALKESDSLKKLNLPDFIVEIGNEAFYKADGFKISAPGVKIVGISAFESVENCFIELSSNLQYCKRNAFKRVSVGGDSVHVNYTGRLEEWLTITFDNEFSNPIPEMLRNVRSISIPEGTTHLNDYAFYSCWAGTVKLSESLNSIGKRCFANARIDSIEGGQNVITIDEGAFEDSQLCTITLSNTLENISDKLFAGCLGLKEILIPNSVKTIGNEAFNGAGLENITLPESIVRLGYKVFYNCNKLSVVELLPETPPKVVTVDGTWQGLTTNSGITNIVVPETAVNTYQTALHWSEYAHQINSEITDRYQVINTSKIIKTYKVAFPNGNQVVLGDAYKGCKKGDPILLKSNNFIRYEYNEKDEITSTTTSGSTSDIQKFLSPSYRSKEVNNLIVSYDLYECFKIYDSNNNVYETLQQWRSMGLHLEFTLKNDYGENVYIEDGVLYNYGYNGKVIEIAGALYKDGKKVISRFDTDPEYQTLYVHNGVWALHFAGRTNGSGTVWDNITIQHVDGEDVGHQEINLSSILHVWDNRGSGNKRYLILGTNYSPVDGSLSEHKTSVIVGDGTNGYAKGVDPLNLYRAHFEIDFSRIPETYRDRLSFKFNEQRELVLVFDGSGLYLNGDISFGECIIKLVTPWYIDTIKPIIRLLRVR